MCLSSPGQRQGDGQEDLGGWRGAESRSWQGLPATHFGGHLLLPWPQRPWGQVSSLQKSFPNKALHSPLGQGGVGGARSEPLHPGRSSALLGYLTRAEELMGPRGRRAEGSGPLTEQTVGFPFCHCSLAGTGGTQGFRTTLPLSGSQLKAPVSCGVGWEWRG